MHSPTEEQECRARLIWDYGATFTKGAIVFGLDDHFSCQRHVNARMSFCEGL